MNEHCSKSNILYVDPNAADKGHLLSDDLFLVECLKPLAKEFLAVTSLKSAENLNRYLDVKVIINKYSINNVRYPRLCLLRNSLSLPCTQYSDIVFQSFEEVSTLLFMYLHPKKRVHLIVTNNLRADRLKRHPILGRFFLREVFRRATSVIVHCAYETETIKMLLPNINSEKLFIKPFHQIALPRNRLKLHEKSHNILFIGPEQAHKRIKPICDLITNDKDQRYRYIFCSMNNDTVDICYAAQNNVQLLFGYTASDAYYRLLSEAALVILTHDRDFEGALSGIFCDAIASGTPIVARDMAPHNEFFEKYGPMGYLVDYNDPAWWTRVLEDDLEGRYEEFQKNMSKCRASCSMKSIREIFRMALTLV